MRPLLQDLRYAVRQLAHTRGFTAIAVITLALGIGGNTIFFAAVNAMVFRPIRATHVDGLYVVNFANKRLGSHGPLTAKQFRRLEADQPTVVARMGAIAFRFPVVAAVVSGRARRMVWCDRPLDHSGSCATSRDRCGRPAPPWRVDDAGATAVGCRARRSRNRDPWRADVRTWGSGSLVHPRAPASCRSVSRPEPAVRGRGDDHRALGAPAPRGVRQRREHALRSGDPTGRRSRRPAVPWRQPSPHLPIVSARERDRRRNGCHARTGARARVDCDD